MTLLGNSSWAIIQRFGVFLHYVDSPRRCKLDSSCILQRWCYIKLLVFTSMLHTQSLIDNVNYSSQTMVKMASSLLVYWILWLQCFQQASCHMVIVSVHNSRPLFSCGQLDGIITIIDTPYYYSFSIPFIAMSALLDLYIWAAHTCYHHVYTIER